MANPLSTFLTSFRPSPKNQTAGPIEKSNSQAYAVGYVPGYSQSLREAVLGQPHDANYDLLYRVYEINTDVSGAVDHWIGVTTGNDWSLRFKDPDYEPTEKDQKVIERVETWLKNPNPDKGVKFDRLLAEIIIDLAVCGDAYVEKVLDGKGLPIELSLIHPSTMSIVTDEYGVIIGYLQRKDGKVVARFAPNEISHFRLPSRKSDLYGQSPLERALEEITQDVKAMVANKSLLDNGFAPAAMLLMNESADEKAAEKLATMIKQSHTGASKFHRLMIGLGVSKVEPWGSTLRDMQFTDLRALATSKIATAFGVPKLFLNQKEAGDFATSDVMERQLYKSKGKMLQKLISEVFTEDIIQLFDQRLVFELNAPDFSDADALRKDALELLKINKLAISVNELRTKHFGLEALDEEELAAKEEAEWQRKQEQVAQQNQNAKDADQADPKDVATDNTKKSVIAKVDDDIDPLAIERDAEMESLEQGLIEPITTYFDDQEADYKARLPENLTESGLDSYLAEQQQAFDAALALLLGSLLFIPLRSGISAAVSQIKSLAAGDEDMQLRIDMSMRFDQTNPVVERYIQTSALEHVQGINTTTREQLRAVLLEGIRNGEGVIPLSERIATVFDKARDYRTDMIARTEVARAYQYANYAAAELLYKEGIVKYRRWLTAPEDGRVCPICRPLNRYTIRFDAKYPDDLEPAWSHVNCRCSEIYLLADEEDLEDWRRV